MRYLVAHTNMSMCFYTIVPMLCGAWRGKRPSSFYLGHLSSSKSFDHITKDASVFNLKLDGSHRLSHFLTSTPPSHTSNHYDRSIASRGFLTYKYDQPTTTCARLLTWRDFHNYFDATCRPVTSPLSLILLLCTFSKAMPCFSTKLHKTL
jgi:hypothetical protein